MGYSSPPLRKQPLSSLATKIIFVVFLSTFLTALVVSWISVHSTYGYLRGEIDRRFPSVLKATSKRISSWLGEGAAELGQLAEEPALSGVLSGNDPAGSAEGMLRAALSRTRFFESLLLVDSSGETLALASQRADPPAIPPQPGAKPGGVAIEAIPAPTGLLTPVAAMPVTSGPQPVLGTLYGVFHREALREMLASDGIGARGELHLVDASGRIQLSSGGDLGGDLPRTDRLPASVEGEVREYQNRSGRRLIGAALPLGELDWTLVLEQPFQEAFQPVFSVMTRVFVIDLCIILLFSFLAYQLTATIVRPIEALSAGARRISRGELDVEIQTGQGSDELGLLTRTFNEMTRKLQRQRAEIRQANRELLAKNEELRRTNEILEQLSITDDLTMLHNHRFFQEHLTREIKRVTRTGDPLSLLLLDIDDFKQLNDRLGHVAGDDLLVGLAQILNDSMRESDLIARYGGDEFVILAANTDLAGAVNLGEKIRTAATEAAFTVGDSLRPTKMTISVGVAQYRGSRKRLFRAADRALYRAKDLGKDCVVGEDLEASNKDSAAFERET